MSKTHDGPQRLLVVAPQGLGDSLQATPIVKALRHEFPSARLDVAVTETGPRLLFDSLPDYVDDVIYLPYWEHGFHAFIGELGRARWRSTYDLAFLAYPSARRAYELLFCALPARRRVAHRHARRMLLDFPLAHSTLVPVRTAPNVERNRDLLRAAGIAPDEEMGYLVPPNWMASPRERVPGRIAIHVGSVAHSELAYKRWPLEHFAELCRQLVDSHDEVTLIVGPGEVEESTVLLRDIPQLRRFEGPLPELSRFLSTCSLVIANDSGIAHLTAGVGSRIVALFGPTPTEFAPFSPNAIALRPSPCPPCFDVRRPVVRCVRNIDFQCLKRDLSVRLVLETIESLRVRLN
jgi:ADP-heptose:LPS heptosyltransferase